MSDLSDERWQKVWEIFHQVVEGSEADGPADSPEERALRLFELCGEDRELAREVEELLAAHDEPPSLLAGVEVGNSERPSELEPTVELERALDPGSRVAGYRIVRLIGEGGMGSVYEALQEGAIERRVALKVIKKGMDTAEVTRRFESERRALALMDHSNIARVFDGGATEDGRPYFAMELIRGVPITEYCDRERLSLRERIDLFLPICRAVQHAHRRGIIHRDLKPSNLLVASEEGRRLPKVIDFGIAKAVGGEATGATLTAFGNIVGTPAYMSPEQAAGRPLDTRTDVYSLGVLLYELLAGVSPFDVESSNLVEIQRQILEQEPPKPSTRVATLTGSESESDIAAARSHSDLGSLAKTLHGDLDWIALKALEKDPDRRYDSPRELAADLERSLTHRPVEAGPPSTLYRLKKFVRRHRLAVASAAALAAALLLGIVGTSWMAVAASRARADAEREAETARAINSFVVDMLRSADPAVDPSNAREIRVVDVLDRAAERLDDNLEERVEVASALRTTLGETYLRIGEVHKAEAELAKALELRRGALGEGHLETLRARVNLGAVQREVGELEEAVATFRSVLEDTRRTLGAEHETTLQAVHGLGNALFAKGDLAAAEALLREAYDKRLEVLGEDHVLTLSSLRNLVIVLVETNVSEAEEPGRLALERARQILAPDHPDTLSAWNDLGHILYALGRFAEAEIELTGALEARRRILGDDHPDTLVSLQNLAAALAEQDKQAEAEPLLREAVAIQERRLGASHPVTLIARHNLGSTLSKHGRFSEAEQVYRDLLPVARDALPAGHFLISAFEGGWGAALLGQGRFAEAESLLQQSYRSLEGEFGPEQRRVQTARARLAELYDRWGKPEQAELYRDPPGD